MSGFVNSEIPKKRYGPVVPPLLGRAPGFWEHARHKHVMFVLTRFVHRKRTKIQCGFWTVRFIQILPISKL